jgi:hypothetical protein
MPRGTPQTTNPCATVRSSAIGILIRRVKGGLRLISRTPRRVGIELARNINRRQARVAHMPFMSIDDPEFWKNCPKGLELIPKSMEGPGGGVAYFVMGEPKDNAPTVVALRMAPNRVLPRHAHDCYRFEVVVQGDARRWRAHTQGR